MHKGCFLEWVRCVHVLLIHSLHLEIQKLLNIGFVSVVRSAMLCTTEGGSIRIDNPFVKYDVRLEQVCSRKLASIEKAHLTTGWCIDSWQRWGVMAEWWDFKNKGWQCMKNRIGFQIISSMYAFAFPFVFKAPARSKNSNLMKMGRLYSSLFIWKIWEPLRSMEA